MSKDETDLREEREWYNHTLAEKVIESFKKKSINGYYSRTKKEALDLLLDLIPPGVSVGRGDSVTLFQTGIMNELRKRDNNILYDPYPEDVAFLPLDERRKLQRQALLAHYFLSGTNAITIDGKLINVDGSGNRVAGIIFGPEKVIIVASINKIVYSVEEGLNRIKRYCAPINNKRHMMKHALKHIGELPCAVTGQCVECNNDFSVCRNTVIVNGVMAWEKGRISVVLVGETLGI